MYQLLWLPNLIVVALLTACVATESTQLSYSEQLRLAKAKNIEQADVIRSTGYAATIATYWMGYQLPKAGKCDSITGNVVLYLIIEKDGTISDVLGDPRSDRAQCYARAYRGMNVPIPPVSPFYFRLDIR